MKKMLSIIMSIALIMQMVTLNAAAIAYEEKTSESNVSNIDYALYYEIKNDMVIEKLYIYQEGYEPVLVEKNVSPDGTIRSYLNGDLVRIATGNNYNLYLVAAQGEAPIELLAQAPTTFSAGCGYTQYYHVFVDTDSFTIDVADTALNESIIVGLLCAYLFSPAVGSVVSLLFPFVQRLRTSDVRYVDVVEDKYFVHGAYINDMNCFHRSLTSYNMSNG